MLYDDIKSRNLRSQDYNSLNEDSTNRKRSTSLTERGTRKTRSTDSDMRPLLNDSLKSFHAELAETCIDFLARHTFSPCAALPKRFPAVEYLLRDGCSQTWLVGHNLITITTSGCPGAPNRHGLCERCAQLSRAQQLLPSGKSETSGSTAPVSPEVAGTSTTALTEKRYTKVSLQHSSGNESAGSTDLTSSSSSTSAIGTSGGTTQRQTSNSSSTSLEALSRRGSNPDTGVQLNIASSSTTGGAGTAGSNTSLLGNSASTNSISAAPSPVQQALCVRACTAWAEIMVRRPTGNISWITRIQNPIANDCFGQELLFQKGGYSFE